MTSFRAALFLLVSCLTLTGLPLPSAAMPGQDEAEAARRSEAQCREGRGDIDACVELGNRLYSARGMAKDHPRALRIWQIACERDSAFACSNAGMVLRWSDVVPHDYPASLALFEKACGMQNAFACLSVGYMYRDAIGTVADAEKARRAYSLACSSGNGEGCRLQGRLYSQGVGNVPQHDGNAVTSYQAGCGMNDLESCALVGFMAIMGRGMAQDADLAIRQYNRACTGGIQFACDNITAIRDSGPNGFGYSALMAFEARERTFPPSLPAEQRYILASAVFADGDVPLAIAGFKALAEEGLADAAFNLGQVYYNGLGVPQDRATAVRYLDRAASAGHPYAKYLMAHFYRSGTFVAYNEIWAIQMMRSAHEEGGIAEAAVWRQWQDQMNARYDARDAANRQMALDNEASQAAADAANMSRIWGLYSSSQNQQENGQVCGTIYRNNQAHYECMARETFDAYYNPNR